MRRNTLSLLRPTRADRGRSSRAVRWYRQAAAAARHLSGYWSRRIDGIHRLVYRAIDTELVVTVWS
ncbi:type II toxin-antitoxin system YoeB family toxin [Thiobaca trueperi]|uniref:type II toxin-antitoxin system YoeB family toxin n=1 Tax=Thiobaca trueperi TaxID=127458 RepID=UPI0031200CC2